MKPMLQLRSAKVGMSDVPDLEASIKQARGGGQPLANSIRKPMEQAFGSDFSRVKVHTDSQSDQLNRSIQARAFTTGHDVFFRQGEYNPENRGGQELLAHELTHVVQQNGGAVQRKSQKEITEQTKSYTVMCLNTQVVQRVIKEIASAASKVVKRTYQQGQITNTQLANIIKTKMTGNYVTHATNQLRDELKGATNVEDRTNPGTTGDRVHFLPSLNNTYGKYIILARKDKLGGQYNPGNGDYIVPGSVPSSKWEGFYLKEQYQEVKKALDENRDPE